MKKPLLLALLFTILSIKSFSQILFEKGYFITESDQKTECLIKNIDWSNNPTDFEYKLTSDGNIQKASIINTKEFSIYNSAKYIRARVKIDRSSDNINDLSTERNPIFEEEQLFLKVLIEGNATLFHYIDSKNSHRFFYKAKKDSEINQLICKQFILDGTIFSNDFYRQQLFNDFRDYNISQSEVEKIKYKQWELEDFFTKLNKDTNSDYTNYASKQKKDLFNLTLRPGLNSSSLTIENPSTYFGKIDFGNELAFRFGIEAEYILPFNKNKWAVMIEPTFQYFKSEKTIQISSYYLDPNGLHLVKVNYTSIELPIGIRHYFFINDKSKIFINASFIFDISTNSQIEFTKPSNSNYNYTLDIKSDTSIGLGSGYKYKDKYSLEMRYNFSRNILANYHGWGSNYSSLNIILGYSFF